MDNPLVKFGSDVYQPGQPINLTYDAFGPPAGFVRGLFEYLYRAEGLTLLPHIPPGITRLEQRFPVRFGAKRLYLATVGKGPITGVAINGVPWNSFDPIRFSCLMRKTRKTLPLKLRWEAPRHSDLKWQPEITPCHWLR